MALFFECTLSCAQKLLDTADIVREAILQQLDWLRRREDNSIAIPADDLDLFRMKAPCLISSG